MLVKWSVLLVSLAQGALLTPLRSSGCGRKHEDGLLVRKLNYKTPISEIETEYTVRLPDGYDPSVPYPVAVFFHGWRENYLGAYGFNLHAQKHNYIVVAPNGYKDGGYRSWNGFGSTGNTDPNKRVCVDEYNSQFDNCYDSCKRLHGDCYRAPGSNYTCWWTTCEDATPMVKVLLDEIEADFCLDKRRIWASGGSNGAMYLYELMGSPLHQRFAGYLPIVGSPHPGFLSTIPTVAKMNFLALWGRKDTTVPCFYNENVYPTPTMDVALDTDQSGWLYATARKTTDDLADMSKCEKNREVIDMTRYDSTLECSQRSSDESLVIECTSNTLHRFPLFTFPMFWDFMQNRTNLYLLDTV